MNNLGQRVITGAGFGIVMILGILVSHWTFMILFFIISGLGLHEFYKLNKNATHSPQLISGIIIAEILFILFCYILWSGSSLSLILVAVPFSAFIFIAELYRKSEQPFLNISITFSGMIYVVLPIMLFVFMGVGFNPEDEIFYHRNLIMGYMILLWSSDSGAYFIGSRFGKHKLFERLSPKKSWEGFFGGLFFSLIAAFIISLYFKDLTLTEWMIVSALIVTFGSVGDLVESMLKRNAGVKDSGTLLPGHGGILDRFDGIFISVPFVFYFLYLLGKF